VILISTELQQVVAGQQFPIQIKSAPDETDIHHFHIIKLQFQPPSKAPHINLMDI